MVVVDRRGTFVAVLVQPRPFAPEQVRRVAAWAGANPYLRLAAAPGLRSPPRRTPMPPSSRRRPPATSTPALRRYPWDVVPVTDDRPFFFRTSRWSHLWPRAGVDPGAPIMELGLLTLLGVSAAAAVAFVYLPLRRPAPAGRGGSGSPGGLLRLARPRLHGDRDGPHPEVRPSPRPPEPRPLGRPRLAALRHRRGLARSRRRGAGARGLAALRELRPLLRAPGGAAARVPAAEPSGWRSPWRDEWASSPPSWRRSGSSSASTSRRGSTGSSTCRPGSCRGPGASTGWPPSSPPSCAVAVSMTAGISALFLASLPVYLLAGFAGPGVSSGRRSRSRRCGTGRRPAATARGSGSGTGRGRAAAGRAPRRGRRGR